MQLAKIRKENLSKIIIRTLIEYIIKNKLKDGDRLPTELKLTEELHVSRSAIREALKVLEFMGLLTSKPKIGTFLTSRGIEPYLLPLIFGVALEDSDLTNIADMRLTMEQGAARQAILKASEKELEDLMALAIQLDEMKKKSESEKEVKESDVDNISIKDNEFHQMLLKLSHNPINEKFSHLWCIFFSRVRDSGEFLQVLKEGKAQVHQVRHQEIVEAIISRNEDLALKLIKNHLSYWFLKVDNVSKDMLSQLVNKS